MPAQSKPRKSTKMPKTKATPAIVAKPKLTLPWRGNKYVYFVAVPLLIYFLFFCFYSWPWMAHFNDRFFTDQGDGFQNVWNMWWVNYSVTHLHQLPWHTTYLHYPYGTSLIAQTLNPFNGFVAIILLKFLSLVQAFNVMVVFSFVTAGLTAFWLCNFFTKRYIPSLVGGFIFTFSSYHFAHAIGHMQLVSLEWIPLFILLWWKLLTRPRYRLAVGAVITLFLILLCDYYYFLYSSALAGIILIYLWRRNEIADWKKPAVWRPLAVFAVLFLVFITPMPLTLLKVNHQDPLQGSHPEKLFSTDIVTPFLDGGFWRFAGLTHWYWKNIHAYVAESSVYLGLSVWVLIVYALIKRTKVHKHINLWIIAGLIFGIFSLGPRLKVNGYSINHAPMPYSVLEKVIPQFKLSGVPIRMMIMVTLSAAVISAMVLSKLNFGRRKQLIALVAFLAVLFVELWPSVLPVNQAYAYPTYVNALSKLPPGAVLDNGAVSASWQLYDQTITGRPMALGYISRTPQSVLDKDNQLIADVAPGKYSLLCSQFKIRYLTTPLDRPVTGDFKVVYKDKTTLIYDLSNGAGC